MSNESESRTSLRPLVFACAGCSHAGRLAYDVAQTMDRQGVAEMSCLAGVGARRQHFLNQLMGRTVWVVDGCPIDCAAGVFENVGRQVDEHFRLQEFGVCKKQWSPQQPTATELVQTMLRQQANAAS